MPFTLPKPFNYSNADDLLPLLGRPHSQSVWSKPMIYFRYQAVHTRKACGIIKPLADGNPNMVLFSPNDHRLPRMLIPIADCPKDFRQRPNDYSKTLFIAQVRPAPSCLECISLPQRRMTVRLTWNLYIRCIDYWPVADAYVFIDRRVEGKFHDGPWKYR